MLLQNVFDNLERARLYLGFSHKKWADLHGLTAAEYERFYLKRSANLPFRCIIQISAALGILPEHLPKRDLLDLEALSRHIEGDLTYLPERYTVGAFGKRMTSATIFKEIEKRIGLAEVDLIMRYLQVKPQAFEFGDLLININFSTDLFRVLRQRGIPPKFIQDLGARSSIATRAHPIFSALRNSRTVAEVYERYVAENVRALERNAVYRLASVSDSMIVARASLNPEVAEALKSKHYGSADLCEFRTGLFGCIAEYGDFAPLDGTKTHCIYKGDSYCQWVAEYDLRAPKQPFSDHRHRFVG